MVFSSLAFLYLFFPLCLVLYFLWNNRVWQNAVLLAFSLFFYAWGEPRLIVMMLAASLIAYIGGILLHRAGERRQSTAKRIFFTVTVILLTANLAVFKYFNFLADNLAALFKASWELPQITLPIGISFYTFQILSYVIDLYRGNIRLQKNFFYLLLYVSFFPQLIAGPIVRYQTVEDEIVGRETRFDNLLTGFKRFIIGLSKKVLLANTVGRLSAVVWAAERDYGTAMWWLAALSYTLQLYFDFSGYSDMAIGLGRMFGFHFNENFNYPYISRSVTEFWRRWHISLSTWFRDYIYIPLGGNRVSRLRHAVNILIVWALTGLWHGAAWNFVLWGLYYGVLLLIEKLFLSKLLERLPSVCRWAYTMFIVIIGWMLFSQESLTAVGTTLANMFTPHGESLLTSLTADASLIEAATYLLPGILCSLPLGQYIGRLRRPEHPAGAVLEDAVCGVLLVVCVMFVTASSFNPFIYFRF